MSASENYVRLKNEVADYAERQGRAIEIVTISKGHDWREAEPVYRQGCRHFGENRLQEALPKIAQAPKDIRWHFVGRLQKNKVREVLKRFSLIHSVEDVALATKISSCSQQMNQVTPLLLQVNTSGEKTKQGLSEEEWEEQLPLLLKLPNICIEGLMTLAPLTENSREIRRCFARLGHMRARLKPHFPLPHTLQHLSMGMSHDYRIALEEGATLLRIGSAIFDT